MSRELQQAKREAEHAIDELGRIENGGTLDNERLTGIRSELLHAAICITRAIDNDDVAGCTIEALDDVLVHGPGYPI